MPLPKKVCKYCDDPMPLHWPYQCFKKPTKREWLNTRSRWLKENPPNHQGYYICYLCDKWVDSSEITLDHIIPRSIDRSLIHDFSNLKPCCYKCNAEKGSKIL